MSQKAKTKELYLGERRVSHMNFSYIVTLPKIFIRNSLNGDIIKAVSITMLEDGSLKLTPIHEKDEPADFTIM